MHESRVSISQAWIVRIQSGFRLSIYRHQHFEHSKHKILYSTKNVLFKYNFQSSCYGMTLNQAGVTHNEKPNWMEWNWDLGQQWSVLFDIFYSNLNIQMRKNKQNRLVAHVRFTFHSINMNNIFIYKISDTNI